ncbi:MAG: DUF885 family protein [Hyphomonadaceae bacterium]
MHMTRRTMLGASSAIGLTLVAGCNRAAQGGGGTEMHAILDRAVTQFLHEIPEFATALGVSQEQAGGPYLDRLSDASREGQRRLRALTETTLTELQSINRDALEGQDPVTYDVVTTALQDNVDVARYEIGGGAGNPYVVTQLGGAYTQIPDFMDSMHPVTNREQADAYIGRLRAYARVLDQESEMIRADAGAGVTPPDFSIDGAVLQLQQFANLRPAETVLVTSLNRRLGEIEGFAAADRTALTGEAETIVRDEVLPAYRRQIETLQGIRGQANHDAGIWKLPQGAEMYAAALKQQTTTSMTPDEIHEMGVDLVNSLHSEMDAILRAEGLTNGSVGERMRVISRRPDQLYANNDAGRAELLADLNTQVQAITARMPEVCNTLARAELQIVRVPEYIQAGAPGGYYNGAALDGSRPGMYYINLRDTAEWPRFTLPTLTYHEGVPGHHWQISIQQESEGLPFIRSAILGFNAYQEGWGLYAEQLADELGFYADDPLGRLGYLQSAVFRSSRLVVDTGIHSKRWTREQAIQSMVEATGDQESSVTTEIERYCVSPGQACGYMVGKQALLRIREEARTAMGERFDIRGFHDAVLVPGPTPLSVTEQLVRQWSSASA